MSLLLLPPIRQAHSMAGQDKRFMGVPPVAEGPWIECGGA